MVQQIIHILNFVINFDSKKNIFLMQVERERERERVRERERERERKKESEREREGLKFSISAFEIIKLEKVCLISQGSLW